VRQAQLYGEEEKGQASFAASVNYSAIPKGPGDRMFRALFVDRYIARWAAIYFELTDAGLCSSFASGSASSRPHQDPRRNKQAVFHRALQTLSLREHGPRAADHRKMSLSLPGPAGDGPHTQPG
jgi:hypothetical protein